MAPLINANRSLSDTAAQVLNDSVPRDFFIVENGELKHGNYLMVLLNIICRMLDFRTVLVRAVENVQVEPIIVLGDSNNPRLHVWVPGFVRYLTAPAPLVTPEIKTAKCNRKWLMVRGKKRRQLPDCGLNATDGRVYHTSDILCRLYVLADHVVGHIQRIHKKNYFDHSRNKSSTSALDAWFSENVRVKISDEHNREK